MCLLDQLPPCAGVFRPVATLSRSSRQAAVSALLELLGTDPASALRGDDSSAAAAVREVTRWQNEQAESWQAVPAALKDKFFALERRLAEAPGS